MKLAGYWNQFERLPLSFHMDLKFKNCIILKVLTFRYRVSQIIMPAPYTKVVPEGWTITAQPSRTTLPYTYNVLYFRKERNWKSSKPL